MKQRYAFKMDMLSTNSFLPVNYNHQQTYYQCSLDSSSLSDGGGFRHCELPFMQTRSTCILLKLINKLQRKIKIQSFWESNLSSMFTQTFETVRNVLFNIEVAITKNIFTVEVCKIAKSLLPWSWLGRELKSYIYFLLLLIDYKIDSLQEKHEKISLYFFKQVTLTKRRREEFQHLHRKMGRPTQTFGLAKAE